MVLLNVDDRADSQGNEQIPKRVGTVKRFSLKRKLFHRTGGRKRLNILAPKKTVMIFAMIDWLLDRLVDSMIDR